MIGRKKAMQSGDQDSSNPYKDYIESIEPSSRSRRSSSSSSPLRRESSGVPTPTTSSSVLPDTVRDFSIWKEKNTQDAALDLVSARKVYEACKTPEEKSALRALLQPIIISRLEKLSEMQQKISDEIADAVGFLESLNPSDQRFVEIGKKSQTSREGMMQLKEAQDKLLSQLRSLPPYDHKDH